MIGVETIGNIFSGAAAMFSPRKSGGGAALADPPSERGRPSLPSRTQAKGRKRRRITGLDIGTTKVCAIIAEVEENGEISVLGLGSSPSRGVKRGVVTDIDHTVKSIEKAFANAFELARVRTPEIYVGIAGDHIQGLDVEGMVEVGNPNVGIDERDCRNVIDRARQVALPADQRILHHVVREFVVNGNSGIHNPIGLFGNRLEVRSHLITASAAAGNNLTRCVKKAGLKTSSVVLQSLASSLSILSQRERDLGVIMIDIGGGTTDIAIFSGNNLQHTAELAYGGDIITQDIAQVLRCSPHDAENLKKKFGHADPLSVDAEERVDLPSPMKGGRRVSYKRRELAEIIEARVEEIFMDVRRKIQRSGLRDQIFAGVVLTGGTALLEGIDGVAERILEFQTRVGMPQGLRGMGEVVSSPIYSTGVGLVKWAVEEGPGYQREQWLIRKIKEVFDIYG